MGIPAMGSWDRSIEHKLTAANAERIFIENYEKKVPVSNTFMKKSIAIKYQ
jgi:hypothetical protein